MGNGFLTFKSVCMGPSYLDRAGTFSGVTGGRAPSGLPVCRP